MKIIEKIIFLLFILLAVPGCTNEKQNIYLESKTNLKEIVSKIEEENTIVENKNGIIKISYVNHNNLENKTIETRDVEELIKLFNYSEIVNAEYRGPSSITVNYTNEQYEEYEFKIWSETIFEFGQLGQQCPEMNCTKFYKIKSEFDMIKYFENYYNEV